MVAPKRFAPYCVTEGAGPQGAENLTARTGRYAVPRPGFLSRSFTKSIALGQYGFPFAIGNSPIPVAQFRAIARAARFAEQSRIRRGLLRLVMTLTWPLGAFATARRTLAQMREWGRTPHGVSVLLDMVWLALRHSIPPLEYGLYRFNEPARRAAMHKYVYWNDLPGLAALVKRSGADNRDVQDKDRFAEICAMNDFPHVRTLAVFEGGRQTHPVEPFVPDIPVLWTKALRLKGGAGGTKWCRAGEEYYDTAGRRVPATQLASALSRPDCIVQPFIDNHPDIGCVSNGALAALRIITGINGEGEAEFVASLLALPHGHHVSSVAGILCAITPETGRIRRAMTPDGTPVSHHPDTGILITDIRLPFWHESHDLVRRAHAAGFARFPFLGWDVALTADGPVLLETNSGWGAMFHQMLDGPLGATAFSRLVALYV